MKGFVTAGLAVALGLAVVAAPAQAQRKANAAAASNPIVWNVGVEAAFPSSSGLNTGFGARVGAKFSPHGWPVWIRPEVSFDHFGISCGGSSCSSSQLGVGADAGYDFKTGSSLKPYGIAGLGFVHTSVSGSFGGFSATASSTNLGINLGGGVRMPVGKMDGYGELRYVSVSGGDSFVITIGLLFGRK